MSVIEKLKAESLRLRKERSQLAPSIAFALSEIEKVGKNNGNRQTTEDEAIKVVQKIVGTLELNNQITDAVTSKRIQEEILVLSSVLPQMVSEEKVRAEISTCVAFGQNKGQIMKHLRTKFGSLVDMRRAGEIMSEIGVA